MTEQVLVGDIGGTNARFALVDAEQGRATGQWQLEAILTLPTAEFENIDGAIRAYYERNGLAVGQIKRACLALACPVEGERIDMTNNHWCFERQGLASQLDLAELKLVNDFTAMALGMLCVDDSDLLQVGGGVSRDRSARLVIGPGTGLGVSGLVPYSGGWIPLAGEGGHISMAPQDGVEKAILDGFQARYGRVSVERALCGQGLLELYQIKSEIEGVAPVLNTPAEVSKAATEDPDSIAGKALRRFFRMLGSTAGDLVLGIGARGGVYLCGGILPRVRELFVSSDFRQAFEHKGRFREYLQEVPVWLCVAEYPGLLGAAAALENSEVSG